MPIYEYECESCGEVTEHWQKLSDAPLTRCPSCQGTVHKVISQSTFHLKGSGWYVTDYAGKRSDNKTPPKKADKPACKADSATASKKASGGTSASD